jgi:hypothetical protein
MNTPCCGILGWNWLGLATLEKAGRLTVRQLWDWNAVGGPGEPKDGLALALSRKPRLKDASCLSGMNRAAKATPTAEPIVDELSATEVFTNSSRLNPGRLACQLDSSHHQFTDRRQFAGENQLCRRY